MKKIFPMLIVGILVISGLGAVAISDSENAEQEITSIAFSHPLLQEKGQYIQIDIAEANSFLMDANKPLLPSYTHTFTFPFGTKIKDVECTPFNVQQQLVSKKIIPAPEPVLAGYKVTQAEKTVSYGNDPYPNTWFEYDVGCGMGFIPPELSQFLPIVDISEVLNAFNITDKMPLPKVPDIFESSSQKSITVEAGIYNAYDISILDGIGNMYYSPEVGMIVKMTGNFNNMFPFMQDINIELKDIVEE